MKSKEQLGKSRNIPALALSGDGVMVADSYYELVRAAYDRIAPSYDSSVGQQAVSRRAKKLALEVVSELTPSKGVLLDVGCYTGVEAVLLARQGHRVLGIDLSTEMVRLAQGKAARQRLGAQVRFLQLRASDLERLKGDPWVPFDTAYSVYGTLNLEPRIAAFKKALADLLRPEGAFVCGLLNPTVLYELIVDPWLLRFHGYRKLRKRAVETGIGFGNDTVKTFLYSPREFSSLMAPEFTLERLIGLHALYPPPRGTQGHGFWWIARAFDAIEDRLQESWPFRELGFFSLLVFRKAA